MPNHFAARAAALLLLSLLCACSQGRGGAGLAAPITPEAAAGGQLPALDQLQGLPGEGRRRVSATNFELLAYAPALQSLAGSSWAGGALDLDATANAPQPAWAVFCLPGFPGDGTVIPTAVDVSKTAQGWVALANYNTGLWEFTQLFSSGSVIISNGANYISPGGVMYAALIAFPSGPNPSGQLHCSSLLAQVSGDLPAGPTAVLEVLTSKLENSIPIQFSHQNSSAGDGTFTGFTYDFGDSSQPHTTTDQMEVVEHTYTDPGNYVVTLTVDADVNSSPMSAEAQQELAVDLVGGPTAVLRVVGTRHAVKYPVRMDAALSDPGLGTWTSIVYDFGDSQTDTQADPATVVEHTYATPGVYTITLTVSADQSGTPRQDTDSVQADVTGVLNQEVLVIYNSNIPESADLANYYMAPETGRAIDPAYQLALPLADAASFTPNIPRDSTGGVIDFQDEVLTPIKAFLDDAGNAAIKSNAKYLLLIKGVPHQIDGHEDYTSTLTLTTCSSVDSELCVLYSYGSFPNGGYVWNGDVYEGFSEGDPNSFMWATNATFSHGQFKTRDINGGTYDLDYLVGRIDAYTYDEAKLIIDRSLAAGTSGSGWTIFDSTQGRKPLDTMVDPVWPAKKDNDLLSGLELFNAAGASVFADVTNATIDAGDAALLPPGFVNSLIGYAGWGVNHGGDGWPHASEYILMDLNWNYLPGACWMSYESYNGTAFSEPPNRRGQGQIADFFRMGGTCAIGNVWEPYTIGVGDERWVFDRYINHGDRWIEAAYKGLRLLSWQEVVVGDPLCQLAP